MKIGLNLILAYFYFILSMKTMKSFFLIFLSICFLSIPPLPVQAAKAGDVSEYCGGGEDWGAPCIYMIYNGKTWVEFTAEDGDHCLDTKGDGSCTVFNCKNKLCVPKSATTIQGMLGVDGFFYMSENGELQFGENIPTINSKEDAMNHIFDRYRYIVVGVSGIGTITMVGVFVLNFIRLGASSAGLIDEQRSNCIKALYISAFAAAGLGSVTMIVGLFYTYLH